MPTALSHILWRVLRLVLALMLASLSLRGRMPTEEAGEDVDRQARGRAPRRRRRRQGAGADRAPSSGSAAATSCTSTGSTRRRRRAARARSEADAERRLRALSAGAVGAARRARPKAAREHFHELTLMPSRFATVARGARRLRLGRGDLESARKGYGRCCRRRTTTSSRRWRAFASPRRWRRRARCRRRSSSSARSYVGDPMHPLAEEALARLTELEGAADHARGAHRAREELTQRIAAGRARSRSWRWCRRTCRSRCATRPTTGRHHEVSDAARLRRRGAEAARRVAAHADRASARSRRCFTARARCRAPTRTTRRNQLVSRVVAAISRTRSVPRRRRSSSAGSSSIAASTRRRSRRSRSRSSATHVAVGRRRAAGTSACRTTSSGDVDGALGDFDDAGEACGALEGGKGNTGARARSIRSKRGDEAKAVWRALVNEYPFSWYALLARARLEGGGIELGPFGAAPRGSAPPLDELDIKLANDDSSRASTSCCRRAHASRRASSSRAASASFLKRYGARARCRCSSIATARPATSIARIARRVATRRRARSDPQPTRNARKWWENAYPRAYRELIEKYSPTRRRTRPTTSIRSCARSRPTTRTTSRTPTRSGSCR